MNAPTRATAILIDSSDAPAGALDACLDAIGRRTENPLVYADVGTEAVDAGRGDSASFDLACTIDMAGASTRGERLQRLYEAARRDGAHHVVVLDAGILPVRKGWLEALVSQVEAGAGLAACVRSTVVCLCVRVADVEGAGMRFDGSPEKSPMSQFVDRAAELGVPMEYLPRSNGNELTDFSGAVYGDIVYVPGTDSWISDDAMDPAGGERRSTPFKLRRDHQDEFVEWIRGVKAEGRVFYVLGMHRSGTSSLTSCLEQCGLFLGHATRVPLPDQPRGNFERRDANTINNAILAASGGDWRQPPTTIEVSAEHRAAIAELVEGLQADAPAGLKDPRTLLTIDAWLEATARPGLVGTYRHPEAVAKSLWDRNRIPAGEAYALWNHYNSSLVELHQRLGFPLIEFDLSDRESYGRRVAALALELGLAPRLSAIIGLLEQPNRARMIPADEPVPPVCQSTYDYLRKHRFERREDVGSLAEALLAWEQAHATTDGPASSRTFGVRMWNLGRHLPRPLRLFLWRGWRKLATVTHKP